MKLFELRGTKRGKPILYLPVESEGTECDKHGAGHRANPHRTFQEDRWHWEMRRCLCQSHSQHQCILQREVRKVKQFKELFSLYHGCLLDRQLKEILCKTRI